MKQRCDVSRGVINRNSQYKGEDVMPVITVEAGQLNANQKSQLVSVLTKEAANIMQANEQHFIVLIKESSRDNIGFGGTWLGEAK